MLLDPKQGRLEVRGCSIHENADRFFLPLIEMVETYALQPAEKTHVKFTLTYFNSSSAKYLLDLLKVFDELHASGRSQVGMEWVYEEGDLIKRSIRDLYSREIDEAVEAMRRWIGLMRLPDGGDDGPSTTAPAPSPKSTQVVRSV